MVFNESVAIVDDEVGVVRTYELLFKRRNIPLSFTAFDGPDAIEKFKNANPQARCRDHRLQVAVDERSRPDERSARHRARHEGHLRQRRR